MTSCLQQLASAWTLNLKTECVDLKRSAKHDLSLPKVRQSYLDRIAAKEFDAVLLSPPCASFSRATWANFRGPRPVRSYEFPRGLRTLTPAERDRAIMGNIFADLPTSAMRLPPWSLMVLLPSSLWNSPRTWVR